MLHRFIEAWRRLLMSVRRLRLERDLDDEVAFQFAMRETDAMAAGASPLGARRDARRRFGNTTLLKERMRDMWTSEKVRRPDKSSSRARRSCHSQAEA